jgi:hypothetical protein
MFAGQTIVGGWLSITVIVKEHVGPAEVAQFTVVVPLGKNEPGAGEQTTLPHPADAVGAG